MSNELGYIKVSKAIQNEEFFKEPTQSYVYFRLLLKANAVSKTIKGGARLNVGQCVIGYDHLASELGLTTSKVRTAIKNLKEQGVIDTEAITRVGTVVTIIDYVENHTFQEAPKKQAKPTKTPTKKLQPLEDRINKFNQSLVPYLDKYGKTMLRGFSDYWTEKSPKGSLMRFEKEKVFDESRRLNTWSKNNFDKNNQPTKADDRLLEKMNEAKKNKVKPIVHENIDSESIGVNYDD